MTPEEAVDAMAERLAAIDYRRHGDKAWSKAAPETLDEIDRAGSIAQFGYVIGPDGEPVAPVVADLAGR
ncbi:hypothetical protein ACIA5D_47935 [Actinoplanes sp. NPDC051513]|uniref:hypothetical protein n=1 Tax=Actinoplanes sp. NPDC051513 TaxID=3363908 RepID=UPI0037A9D282